jgi:glycosyltransferase involved in cell wall biosynthesis
LNLKKELNAEWVILAGRVPFFNITEYIELADLCLLSFAINDITKEITPIKIIEYMAMKKPVLSNALPGVVDQIGKNSDVIFTKNQKALVKKIAYLSQHKDKLENLGFRVYKVVKEGFTWNSIIKNFKNILLKELRKR